MKKNFFKKLASGLALAMVVTSFAPAAPALAAKATTIVKQGGAKAPTTVYVGKKVDYSLNNLYSTNTYKWFTSNGAVAKVTKTGGVVTPVATGTATIKVNAYKKSTGKFVKSFTLKLDVKQRATSVEIGAEDFELAVGETKDLNAVKTPATSTDTLRYLSSDEKVATVDLKTGLVKAVAPGEATIKVAAKGAWFTANNSKYNKYDQVKVTVVDGVQSVKQLTTTKIDVKFATDQSKNVTKDNLVITDANGVKQIINTIAFSEDGKTATVSVFVPFADKVTYKVSYKETSVDFTASKGEVASIAVSGKTVQYGSATGIDVKLFDANGVDVTTDLLLSTNVTFEYDNSKAYVDPFNTTDKYKITVFNYPESITLKAVYHTYTYENGVEKTFESAAVINSVKELPVTASGVKYTLSKTTPNWDKVVTAIPADATEYQLFMKAKNHAGVEVTESSFNFESTDINVLTVSKSSDGKVYVYPLKAGSVYIKATYGDTIQMLPITVGAASATATVTADKTTVSLYDSLNDSVVVTLTGKDQYGVEASYAGKVISVEHISGNAKDKGIINWSSTGLGENQIRFNIVNDSVEAKTAGLNTFKLTFLDKVVIVYVNLHDVTNKTVSYINVDRTEAEINAVLKSDTSADKTSEFTVYGYNSNGQKVKVVNDATFTIKFKNVDVNDSTETAASYVDHLDGTATFTALKLGAPVSQAAIGTYLVEATANINGTKKATTTVTVTNSQVAPVVTRKATNLDFASNANVAQVIDNGLTIKINGTNIADIKPLAANVIGAKVVVGSKVHTLTSIAELTGLLVNAGDSVVIKTITVQESFGANTINHVVNVDLAFIVK